MSQDIKLNLGCGGKTPDGWINTDYFIGARLIKIPLLSFCLRKFNVFQMNWNKNIFIHDLTKEFPWEDSSIDVIYTSHTLEHFDKVDGTFFLNECKRILRVGGILRVIVPDFFHLIKRYNSGSLKSYDFINSLGVLPKKPLSQMSLFEKLFSFFFSYPHKCMYDEIGLKDKLIQIGFNVKSAGYNESKILDINNIENEDRCHNAVILECTKQ